MDRGNLAAAQQRFEEAVRKDPRDYRARYYLGEVFFRRRQFDEAKAQFREALRIKPDAQSVRYELGLIAEEEGRYDEAYDLHREVIANAPGSPAAKASSERFRLFGETRESFRASHEHFAAANRLIAQGKFDAGEAELRVVIQIAPGNINALSLLGRILLQSKKDEEAIPIFERIVRLNPNAVGSLYQLALLYEDRQEFDRAIAAYKEIIARGKGTPQADAAQKKLAIIGEDPAAAKKGFELFESGEKALKDGKLDDARRYFQEVLALLPRNSAAHMAMADIDLREGKEDDAISEYKAIHAVEPTHYPSHYALGILYTARGLLDEAKEEFRIVVEHSKEEQLIKNANSVLATIEAEEKKGKVSAEARTHQSRAIEYSRNKQFPEAVLELEAAIRISPNNPYFHYNLGIVYANMGQFDQSYVEFKKAVELKPDHLPSHFRLGLFYRVAHLYVFARQEFEKTISLAKGGEPELEEAKKQLKELSGDVEKEQEALGHSVLGQVFFSRQDLVRARKQFEEALETDPSNAVHHFNLGLLEQQEGFLDFAEADYSDTLNIDPTFSKAYYRLARLRESEGEIDEAIDLYNHALEYNPGLTEIHYNLGVLFEQKGLYLPAREQYQLFLDENPSPTLGTVAVATSRLKYYEKPYTLTLNYNLITYDSNISSSRFPTPDYTTGYGATFAYYTYRTPRFSLPIVLTTSNTFYALSQFLVSTNSIGPRIEENISDVSLNFLYKIIYIHTQNGPSSRTQHWEGGATWRPSGWGSLANGFTWTTLLPTFYSIDYIYQDSYSLESPLLDATRGITTLTLGKFFYDYGLALFTYTLYDNNAINPGQRYRSRSWSIVYFNTFAGRFHFTLSYSQSTQEFTIPDIFSASTRKNRLSSPSFGLSYDLTANTHFNFSITYQSNKTNFRALSPGNTLAQITGQSTSLSGYRRTLVSTGLSFNF